MTFDKLGPMLDETRTPAVCQICGDYIYKRIYHDENSKDNRKTVFVCKNCLNNDKK
jgi:hypothetical protein